MKDYVVSIVWVKQSSYSNMNLVNTIDVHRKAASEEEAYGKSLVKRKDLMESHKIELTIITEI